MWCSRGPSCSSRWRSKGRREAFRKLDDVKGVVLGFLFYPALKSIPSSRHSAGVASMSAAWLLGFLDSCDDSRSLRWS